MPRTSISSGQTVGLATANNAGDVFYLAVESGSVTVGKHERTARLGRTLQEDDRVELEAKEDGETLYVHAVSNATVVYERQGWALNLFGREIVRVENSPDQNNLNSNTAQQSARGVVEVGVDVTPPTGTQSNIVTVQADTDEVWELRAVLLEADPASGVSSGEDHEFTLQTEAENVELAHGKGDADQTLALKSSTWIATNGTGLRRDAIGTEIDDNNGIEIQYVVDSGADPTKAKARYQFRVLVA
jgi:hypothetical protein